MIEFMRMSVASFPDGPFGENLGCCGRGPLRPRVIVQHSGAVNSYRALKTTVKIHFIMETALLWVAPFGCSHPDVDFLRTRLVGLSACIPSFLLRFVAIRVAKIQMFKLWVAL